MAALQRRRSQVQKEQKKKRSSLIDSRRGLDGIFDRLGDTDTSQKRIIAKNIGGSIATQDVRALFATAGSIQRVVSYLNGSGSTATYEIDFSDGDAARKALYEFDQRTLDGRKMMLSLATADGETKANKSNRDSGGAKILASTIRDATVRTNTRSNTSTSTKKPSKSTKSSVVLDVGSLITGKEAEKKASRKSSTSKKFTPVRANPKVTKQTRSTRR